MLGLEHVSKVYSHRGKPVNALRDATLEVQEGEFVTIVGPSGSGKSTLLLILGGMLRPSEGRVFLNGYSLYDLNPNERAGVRRSGVGFVFQTFNLVPYLTARENVQVPLYLAGVSASQQKVKATSLLEQVGLSDRVDHKPAELSVGQQQRVALARVLANDPPVILADEPTGNLDPDTAGQVMTALQDMNRQGRTVVMVTHDLPAAGCANRSLRLVEGSVQPGGP